MRWAKWSLQVAYLSSSRQRESGNQELGGGTSSTGRICEEEWTVVDLSVFLLYFFSRYGVGVTFPLANITADLTLE